MDLRMTVGIGRGEGKSWDSTGIRAFSSSSSLKDSSWLESDSSSAIRISSRKESAERYSGKNWLKRCSGGGVSQPGSPRKDQVLCGLVGSGEARGVLATATSISPRRLGKEQKGIMKRRGAGWWRRNGDASFLNGCELWRRYEVSRWGGQSSSYIVQSTGSRV